MADSAPSAPPTATSVAPGGTGSHTAEPEGEIRLAREITFVDATMMGVGALMGGGVFVLLGLAAGLAGPAVLLALFLNGFITIPTLMVYAELGSASDDAGGGYLWVRQGLGKLLGFMGGWFGWFSHIIACGLYSIASAAFVLMLLHLANVPIEETDLLVKGLAVGLCALFVFLNYIGVKIGIKTENVVNTAVLFVVIIFVLFGLKAVADNPELARFNIFPFFGGASTAVGMSNVFLAMGLTFIAFEGYEIISQTSEEIQNPRKNIPRAIWASFLIVWALMLVIAFIALGVAQNPLDLTQPGHEYLGSLKERALAEIGDQVMPAGTVIIAGSALLLQLTALNATLYSSSRVSFAMGRDGNLPHSFGRVHPKRRTPHIAVLGSGVIALCMAVLPIHYVAASADVMFLLLFLLVNLAYIKLRKVIPAERFGVRAPFFPYLPIFGIMTKLFLAVYLYQYAPFAWYVTAAWIGLGLIFYYSYVRRQPAMARDQAPLAIPVGPLPMAAAGPRKDVRILALLTSPAPSTARALAKMATNLAKAMDGEVILLQAVLVPEVTPLAEGSQFYKDRKLLDEARTATDTVPTKSMVRIGHNLDRIVRDAVDGEGATLLLMSGQARATVGQPTSALLAYPPCDVAVLRLKRPDVTGAHVVVAAHGSVHGPLSIKLATAFAATTGGTAKLIHVVRPGDDVQHRTDWANTMLTHHADPRAAAKLDVTQGAAVNNVLASAKGADLVVLGTTAAPRMVRRSLLGHKSQEILDRVSSNVLLVRSKAPTKNVSWAGRRLMSVLRYIQPE